MSVCLVYYNWCNIYTAGYSDDVSTAEVGVHPDNCWCWEKLENIPGKVIFMKAIGPCTNLRILRKYISLIKDRKSGENR